MITDIWNSSNCKCECDKSCDVGEYLDSKNCKCREKVVDKLVEEWTENIEEVEIISKNEHKNNVVLVCYTLRYFQ